MNPSDKHTPFPFGSRLSDGPAHQASHTRWSRRDFLTQLGLAGGASMVLGGWALKPLSASPLMHALASAETERVLVLIQLKGGNDGLNTLIPLYEYDFYANQRPGIRIPEQRILPLSDEHGLPDSMEAIIPLWQEGQMKVVQSVGYPNQNLSHFRSGDIWTTASDADVLETSGWLGRWLDSEFPDFLEQPPEHPPAIQIGGAGTPLFNNGETNLSVSVANPDQLFEIAQTGQLYDPQDVPANCYGEELQFVRTLANSTFQYAEVIKQAYDASNNQASYGNTGLDRQLALVARLIKGQLGTRLYLVTLDGFDTHANQGNLHPYLLRSLSTALRGFYEDLGLGGQADRVLSMTFSEFGRRIEQNASMGTDHGSAAPLMMFGSGLNGQGIVGTNPDLQQPDAFGNLAFHTDFREVYATVLEQWLCVDPGMVNALMGRSFPRIMEFGLSCQATSRPTASAQASFTHQVQYVQGRQTLSLRYHLPSPSDVRVEVFTLTGQRVWQQAVGYQSSGTHRLPLPLRAQGLKPGTYAYRIHALGRSYGKTLSVIW